MYARVIFVFVVQVKKIYNVLMYMTVQFLDINKKIKYKIMA